MRKPCKICGRMCQPQQWARDGLCYACRLTAKRPTIYGRRKCRAAGCGVKVRTDSPFCSWHREACPECGARKAKAGLCQPCWFNGVRKANLRVRARSLRADGKTFEQIGDELGLSRQRAHELAKSP